MRYQIQSLVNLSTGESIVALGSSVDHGLTSETATARLAQDGPNRLKSQTRNPIFFILLRQFTGLPVLVLFAAAGISAIVGETQDCIAIVSIILLNGILGFSQEYRAENAMVALRKLSPSRTTVLRDGRWSLIHPEAIVTGDIISLQSGDLIPADVRLIETHDFEIDESALTGESQPIRKTSLPLKTTNTPIPDMLNAAFKGTLVTKGRGVGLVVATGMQTELGRIAGLMADEKMKMTPLQMRLAKFSKRLALIVIALCIVIFSMGMTHGEDSFKVFMTALSLAVAAIPEALPAVTTILLALGARIMAGKNALVRSLPAVETLGSATYVCTDKTGTLTENRLTVESFGTKDSVVSATELDINNQTARWLLYTIALNNDASFNSLSETTGDPTEVALLRAAKSLGIDRNRLVLTMPRLAEVPFSSERMMMSTLHPVDSQSALLVKGAPEIIISRCSFELLDDDSHPINKSTALAVAGQMAASGQRVLACAMRKGFALDKASIEDRDETDLTLLGFVGLIDPPRPGALQAVKACHQASINVVMITGDHPTTAIAIAKKLEILPNLVESDDYRSQILTGAELRSLDDIELVSKVRTVRVYARVAPEDKIRIVKALQTAGEFVAMTGDGVNDAPALRRADIGVSMGKGGTDVARESSQLILLDDNFSTIVAAIKEGRRIFDNIRKFIRYVLTGNSGEIWALFLAQIFDLPLPLLPIQILFVNLLTDGLPGIALSAEPAESNILNRPPRRPSESVFAHGLWQHALLIGLLLGILTLIAFKIGMTTSIEHGQTMAFTVLTLGQLVHVVAIRSETNSIFSSTTARNHYLLAVVAVTFAVQIAAVYNTTMRSIFGTHPITGAELLLCLGLASVIGFATEFEKAVYRISRKFNRPLDLEAGQISHTSSTTRLK